MKTSGKRIISKIKSFKLRTRETRLALLAFAIRARRRLADITGKRLVSIEISCDTLRILETKGNRVRKWGSVSLREERGEQAFPTAEYISARIKELIRRSHINAGKAFVGISGLYSVNRLVEVGRATAKQVSKEMPGAVKETVSLNIDEVYVSWEKVLLNEEVQHAFAISVPRDLADVQLRALKRAGIRPKFLELNPAAAMRTAHKEKMILLCIEPSSFDIVIVSRGVPYIMRTLAWNQEESSPEDGADYLIRALEVTVRAFNNYYLDDLIDPSTPIFATGQVSSDNLFMSHFEARLNYPLERLATPLQCPASFPLNEYAGAVGLALRGLAGRKQAGYGLKMDLLPEGYRPWRPTAKQLGFVLGALGCLAVLSSLYQTTTEASGRITNLDSKYSILNGELQRRQLEIKNRVPLQKIIDEFRLIQSKSGGLTKDIEIIYSTASKLGVEIKSVSHDVKSVTVTIQAEDFRSFRDYAVLLQESERFSAFELPPEGFPFTKSGAIKFKTGSGSTPTPAPIATPKPSPTTPK